MKLLLCVAIACGIDFFSFLPPARARLPPLPLAGFSGVADAGVGSAMGFSSSYFFVAFFLPAIVCFRGPLRVLAFVCVRWPRTGRLRRWRIPR